MSDRKQTIVACLGVAVLIFSIVFTYERGFKEEQVKLTPKYDQSGQVKKACERFIAAN